MRKTINTLAIGASVLLFTGCTGNQPEPLSQQIRIVKNIGNHYYNIPHSAGTIKMDDSSVYMNKVSSSGLLQCKRNYALIIHPKVYKKEKKTNDKYINILTPKEILAWRKNYKNIPKINSKEFQALVKLDTQLVREGNLACIPPMSQGQVKQYKAKRANQAEQVKRYQAQQAKINNDPRVVAARIQAQSARNVANAQIKAADDRAVWDNLSRQTAQMNQMSQQLLNRNKTYNVRIVN